MIAFTVNYSIAAAASVSVSSRMPNQVQPTTVKLANKLLSVEISNEDLLLLAAARLLAPVT